MLTLIHGSDTATARKYFLDQKQLYPDAILLDADKVNLTDLAQIFEGGGLFSESKVLFIEQFLVKKKKSSDFKDIIAYLEKHGDEHTIFLWENKELDFGTLKTFKRAANKAFKLPQTLFTFLDELKPGNGPALIPLFRQTIASTEAEMVYFMLIRHFRLLLALSSSQAERGDPVLNTEHIEVEEIDELKKMQPWQRTKLERQAAFFTPDQLKDIYTKLYLIEAGQKTGTLGSSMTSAIDFFLLEV